MVKKVRVSGLFLRRYRGCRSLFLEHPTFVTKPYFWNLTWNFVHIEASSSLACTKNFRNFGQSLSAIWNYQGISPLPYSIYIVCFFWKLHVSVKLHSKLLKLFIQARLDEASMWTKFQVKFQKYGFVTKVGVF